MKNANKVKICACFLLCVSLAGCKEYEPPTSHYGTGKFHCYYHDVRNGQIYSGVSREEKKAATEARQSCVNKTSDLDHQHCEYAECVFK